MKILIMDTLKTLGSDGCTIHRWELARNLSKLGHEVHVISYTDTKLEGVHIYTLNKKSKIRYILHLIRLVKSHHFDIIYTRNIMVGSIGFLTKKVWKSKLILEINGISTDERRLIGKQLAKRKKFSNIKLVFFEHFGIFIMNKADAIITITQGIKNYLIDHGVDKTKMGVIENGANTELFKPVMDINTLDRLKNRLHINDSESVVVFVGNLAPWQGVEYLLHAVPLIVEENPKTKFLIVGDGIMKDKLESLTKELNIIHRVIFTGTVPYESVSEYINLSDICVAPFIRTRNESIGLSPLKIYEYLACGKPVVASDIQGVGNLLESSNSGIPVIPDNPNELAKAIIQLLNDKQLREQMGKNGREMVVKNYSWENTAKKTIDVFESISNK